MGTAFNLNQFWNQVREDTRLNLPDKIWRSTIYWLLPSSIDEQKGVITFMVMQSFIKQVIEGEPTINTVLRNSIEKQWRKILPNTGDITIIITSVDEETNGTADETGDVSTTHQGATMAPRGAQEVDVTPSAQPVQSVTPTVEPAVETAPTEIDFNGYSATYTDYNNYTTGPLPTMPQTRLPEPPTESSGYYQPTVPYYDTPVIVDKPTTLQRPTVPDLHVGTTTDLNTADDTSLFKDYEETTDKSNATGTGISDSMLNASFTFDSFVAGGSNQLAYAAALNVADFPAQRYNPLFIYGESGLGKTHLMHAIGNKLKITHPEFKIMCITSENFLNSFVASIRSKQNDEFRNTFRKVDVLLVDDIQFIQDRRYTGTQMEFFHTFNDLINNTKQIILTSDTLPKNMDQMEERLKTRFSSGLVVTIDPPTPEMLQAILRTMVDNEHMKLPELNVPLEVIQFLSKMFNKRSVRDLQGAFNKLVSAAELDKRLETIDAEYTRKVLSDVLPDDEQPILSVKYIQDCVAAYYQIKRESLLSQKRNKQYAVPRQVAMYLCRELINESYPQISQAFGKKDHTTALYAYEKISKKVSDDADFRRQIEDIKDTINNAT